MTFWISSTNTVAFVNLFPRKLIFDEMKTFLRFWIKKGFDKKSHQIPIICSFLLILYHQLILCINLKICKNEPFRPSIMITVICMKNYSKSQEKLLRMFLTIVPCLLKFSKTLKNINPGFAKEIVKLRMTNSLTWKKHQLNLGIPKLNQGIFGKKVWGTFAQSFHAFRHTI